MTLAIIVFVIYCIVLFLVGLTSSKDSGKSDLEYYLDNRKLNSYQIGLSAGATGNTGFIMTGAIGLGYAYGIDWLFLPLAWFLGDLVYWKFFPQKLNEISHRENIISPINIIAKGRWTKAVFAVILILSIGSYASSQFIASAKSLTGFFGLESELGILVTGIVILGYLAFGGFRASVRSDIIQAAMMILVTLIVLIHVVIHYDILSSYSTLKLSKSSEFYIPFKNSATITLIAFFVGWSFAAIGFGLGQPQIIARYFAGRSKSEVAKAKWTYISFLQFTWFGMTLFGYLLGIGGFKASDPEGALAEYSLANFTPFISGLILAGVFSAIASTIDSMSLAISTSISHDILGREQSAVARYITLVSVVVILGFVSAAIKTGSSTVFVLAKLSISLMTSSLGLAILMKLMFRDISEKALILGAAISTTICCVWYYLDYSNMIVESLPAVLVGGIVTYVLYIAKI